MRFNFKKCQEQYPDALEISTSTFPGRPITEEQLAALAGGGKILHSWRSKDGYKIKVVVSKLAAARIMVIYGPQGSGKSTLAQKYAKLFKSSVTVPFSNILYVEGDPECLVIEGFPGCLDQSYAEQLFCNDRRNLRHVIITVQTSDSTSIKPREGFFFIKKTPK